MFTNRVAVVTGSARGIGCCIAERLARQGAAVIMSDIDGPLLEGAVQKLADSGCEARAVRADVTREDEIAALVADALKMYGRLDILVNNAGLQHVAPIEDFPTERFEFMLKLMLTAPFIAIKHALPHMKRRRYGRILNIASINGLVGFSGKAAYNSAKHGVIGLTKVAALEAAPYGITVNALCPGYVDTPLVRGQLEALAADRNVAPDRVLEEVIYPLVPQRRLLEPAEVAEYALFLAGESAKGVTGQAVVLDGGYTAQ